jgi:DMSO/TMAO reductase YedYZ heme-binding membrane subunit
VLIPLASPYEPLWVGAGQVSLYLSLVVTLSLYVRRQIGQRAWRIIHYLSYGAFVLVALHGLLSGTDSASLLMRMMYAGSVLLVTGLTVYRVIAARRLRLMRRAA